jgi:hypothetical protein
MKGDEEMAWNFVHSRASGVITAFMVCLEGDRTSTQPLKQAIGPELKQLKISLVKASPAEYCSWELLKMG